LYDAFVDLPKDAWRTNINRKSAKYGWTRLHIHAINGNADGVRQSIFSGAELNVTDHVGATALNWAARSGHLDVVKMLVDESADVEIPNNDKMTALDYARHFNYPGMADYLERMLESHERGSATAKREGPEVWVWIDQISINQSDLEERCSQVGIMHQIYSKSTFTLIWLGREDSWTKSAVSAISKLAATNERFVNSNIVPYVKNSETVFQEAKISYISEKEWESLAALFQRQYFRRLW
jgi:hypothetical protein